MTNYLEIIDFWFDEVKPEQWYDHDELLDLKMVERFIALHSAVVAGELSYWRSEPFGRLAEILVIDQFSRNIYRDDPKSFIYDPMALALAQEMIRGNYHVKMKPRYKQFLYMPFMHSESKLIHNSAVLLFSEPGLENSLEFELQHKKIIDRFGRYPHRNKILGRTSTPEEVSFLNQSGSTFESKKGIWQKTVISIDDTTVTTLH